MPVQRPHPTRNSQVATRSARSRWGSCLIAILVVLGITPSVFSQHVVDQRREYNVKAVSLYGFGRYVTWPPEAFSSRSDPFVIAILGSHPFGTALDRIAKKKTIHGRSIEIRYYRSIQEYRPCHILFVSRSINAKTEAKILQKIQGQHVLLVGETDGFAKRGGMVNFFIAKSSVRFELNVEAALQEQLALNAKIHRLGVRVRSP